MSTSINILNVKIPRRGDLIEGGISIEEGKIVKIGKNSKLQRAGEKIEAKGLIALPGLIDVHVHLRDLQLAYKEDFYTGTCAAAAGGFSTIIDMPNTVPPTSSVDKLKEKFEIAKSKIVVNVGFNVAFTYNIDEIERMVKAGAISFKLNLYNPAAEIDVNNEDLLLRSMLKCAALKVPVTVHAEDRNTVDRLKNKFLKSGKADIKAYLKCHSAEAELKAVNKVAELAKRSGVQIHICHVSAASSLKTINEARGSGLKLSCEVTPHHMFLAERDVEVHGGISLTDPPVRTRENALKLWKALVNGEIDVVASDHAPHAVEEKLHSNVWQVSPGVPGLETTLPLLLTKVNKGELTLQRLIAVLAQRPAEIFGLTQKGCLKEGADADITLIDLKSKFRIDSSKFLSKAKYSPFNGFNCIGKPVKTFVSGRLVMDGGEIIAKPGSGSLVKAV